MYTRHEVGVARQIGSYSDAIEVARGQRWLFSAGTPGLNTDGTLPPAPVRPDFLLEVEFSAAAPAR